MIIKLFYLIVFYLTILTFNELFKLLRSNQPTVLVVVPKEEYYYSMQRHLPQKVQQEFEQPLTYEADEDYGNIITGNTHSIVYDNMSLNNKIIKKRYHENENKSILQNIKFSNSVNDAFHSLTQRDINRTPLNIIKKR